MASTQIINRTAKNLNPKLIDFSATPLQGNLEANFLSALLLVLLHLLFVILLLLVVIPYLKRNLFPFKI